MSSEVKERPPLFTEEEVSTMFDSAFLPTLQKIAKNYLPTLEQKDEVIGFKVELSLRFEDLESPLKYEEMKDCVHLQLIPLLPPAKEEEPTTPQEEA